MVSTKTDQGMKKRGRDAPPSLPSPSGGRTGIVHGDLLSRLGEVRLREGGGGGGGSGGQGGRRRGEGIKRGVNAPSGAPSHPVSRGDGIDGDTHPGGLNGGGGGEGGGCDTVAENISSCRKYRKLAKLEIAQLLQHLGTAQMRRPSLLRTVPEGRLRVCARLAPPRRQPHSALPLRVAQSFLALADDCGTL